MSVRLTCALCGRELHRIGVTQQLVCPLHGSRGVGALTEPGGTSALADKEVPQDGRTGTLRLRECSFKAEPPRPRLRLRHVHRRIDTDGVTALYASRRYVRATIGDEFYGPSCPRCSNPKDDQALQCRECYRDQRRDATYWSRRSCACGAPKHPESARCNPCKYERQRKVGVLSGP